MKKFYQLRDDIQIPNRWHLSDPMTDEGCEPWEFQMGRIVHLRSRPIVDVKSPGVPLDFTLTLLDTPIASPRLHEAISHLYADDVQRLPVQVGNRDGYQILNVVRLVYCLDESKSEFLKFTEQNERPDLIGNYKMVTKLRIDTSLVPEGVNIFRIAKWDVALIVSQAVVDAMRSIKATGPVFLPTFD